MTSTLLLVALLNGLTQASTPDAWITTKTKLALFTTAGVSSTDVNVDTVDGMVTLHGKVISEDEKTRAEEEAKKIAGVRSVRNLLQVVIASRQGVMDANDKVVKENIEKALKADRSLTDSSISVQSVDNGVVLLSGTAASLSDHLRAVETACATPGVKAVRSEVRSPNELADERIWRDRGKNPAQESFADGASDVWITTEIRMRLIADDKVPALDVSVDTRAGVVVLFGIVPSEEAKHAAAADAHKIRGVREVRNELQVVSSNKSAQVKVHDGEMKKAIESELKTADFTHVNVDVKNGVARLSGSVHSAWDRLHAATMTRSTRGVRSVEDDLKIHKN